MTTTHCLRDARESRAEEVLCTLAAYRTWYLVPLDAFMTVVLISNYRPFAISPSFQYLNSCKYSIFPSFSLILSVEINLLEEMKTCLTSQEYREDQCLLPPYHRSAALFQLRKTTSPAGIRTKAELMQVSPPCPCVPVRGCELNGAQKEEHFGVIEDRRQGPITAG